MTKVAKFPRAALPVEGFISAIQSEKITSDENQYRLLEEKQEYHDQIAADTENENNPVDDEL